MYANKVIMGNNSNSYAARVFTPTFLTAPPHTEILKGYEFWATSRVANYLTGLWLSRRYQQIEGYVIILFCSSVYAYERVVTGSDSTQANFFLSGIAGLRTLQWIAHALTRLAVAQAATKVSCFKGQCGRITCTLKCTVHVYTCISGLVNTKSDILELMLSTGAF